MSTQESTEYNATRAQSFRLAVPVVFIVFNRPDTTARTFKEIARARPPRLLVVADGPRPGRVDEAELCALTRSIATNVDWPCELSTNFAASNMGCRARVASGLDWAFSLVDEAIILEDDCLPAPSFFRFCELLLARYRDDDRVAQIGGVNFQGGIRRSSDSYYFSRYNHIWGWATWRRAWALYDDSMSGWSGVHDRHWLRAQLGNAGEARFWGDIFDRTVNGEINAWSYPWLFACWKRGMLSIVPATNLVSNVGFGADATHTKSVGIQTAVATRELAFPLIHPLKVERNVQADAYTDRKIFTRSPLHQFVRWLKQRIPALDGKH